MGNILTRESVGMLKVVESKVKANKHFKKI